MVLSALLALSWTGFFVVNSGIAQEDRAPTAQWSYASAQLNELTKMGADGWEAYAVTYRHNLDTPTFWLKKPM
jgi:hypothetical protein